MMMEGQDKWKGMVEIQEPQLVREEGVRGERGEEWEGLEVRRRGISGWREGELRRNWLTFYIYIYECIVAVFQTSMALIDQALVHTPVSLSKTIDQQCGTRAISIVHRGIDIHCIMSPPPHERGHALGRARDTESLTYIG